GGDKTAGGTARTAVRNFVRIKRTLRSTRPILGASIRDFAVGTGNNIGTASGAKAPVFACAPILQIVNPILKVIQCLTTGLILQRVAPVEISQSLLQCG